MLNFKRSHISYSPFFFLNEPLSVSVEAVYKNTNSLLLPADVTYIGRPIHM